jgi:hypothetical protein
MAGLDVGEPLDRMAERQSTRLEHVGQDGSELPIGHADRRTRGCPHEADAGRHEVGQIAEQRPAGPGAADRPPPDTTRPGRASYTTRRTIGLLNAS